MPSELSLLFAEQHWLLPFIYALFGLCIGSYLNVIIYRLPRGQKTNEPAHSFCPHCKRPLAWYHNIPVLSWICLRARSACCKKPISWQYPLVELSTALLFAALVAYHPQISLTALAFLCLWGSAAIVIIVMDWQEMIVMARSTLFGSLAGFCALALDPRLTLPDPTLCRWSGIPYSLIGMASGFLLLKLVGWTGQLLLGRRSQRYRSPQTWELKASPDGEDIELRIGEEQFLYSELFMERRDRIHLKKAQLLEIQKVKDAAQPCIPLPPSRIILNGTHSILRDGTRLPLEQYDSLSGTCKGWIYHRSVLGSGDAWIVMMIGAVCGWQGVLFSLFAGSVIGLLMALVMRLGRGRPMPFGPSLVFAALLWIFGASHWPEAYLSLFR